MAGPLVDWAMDSPSEAPKFFCNHCRDFVGQRCPYCGHTPRSEKDIAMSLELDLTADTANELYSSPDAGDFDWEDDDDLDGEESLDLDDLNDLDLENKNNTEAAAASTELPQTNKQGFFIDGIEEIRLPILRSRLASVVLSLAKDAAGYRMGYKIDKVTDGKNVLSVSAITTESIVYASRQQALDEAFRAAKAELRATRDDSLGPTRDEIIGALCDIGEYQKSLDDANAEHEANARAVAAIRQARAAVREAENDVADAQGDLKEAKKNKDRSLQYLGDVIDKQLQNYPLFNQARNDAADDATAEADDADGDESLDDLEAWRDVTLEELGISPGLCEKLREASITTMGQLAAWTEDHCLTDIDGIGPKAAERIEDATEAYWQTH